MYAQDHNGIGNEESTSFVKGAYGNGGAHRMGAQVFFSFAAADADKVFLVGSFNDWCESHPMRRNEDVWLITLRADEISDGDTYKYKVYAAGQPIYASDPYSPETDGEPYFNSVYRESYAVNSTQQPTAFREVPMSIYSIRANAWAYGSDGKPLPYEMLSNELLPYLLQMGYTHVCISDIFDRSLSVPVKEQGGTDGLRKFIRRMHTGRIGVLIGAECDRENAHRTAERYAFWADTLAADGILIDASYKRELEFYYELYSSLKRINRNILVVSLDNGASIPSDITVRECVTCPDSDQDSTRDVAAEATEILLGEGRMLTRAGCELGIGDRSAAVDWKRTDCADCARLQLYLSELNRVYLSNHIVRLSNSHHVLSEENCVRMIKKQTESDGITLIRNTARENAEVTLESGYQYEILISKDAQMCNNTVRLAGGAICAVLAKKQEIG